jgi:hypothetical protein
VERADWLKKMRTQAEALYDHLAPAYWVTFGLIEDEGTGEWYLHPLARKSL